MKKGLDKWMFRKIMAMAPVRDMLNFAQTCKYINAVQSDETFWMYLYKRDFPNKILPENTNVKQYYRVRAECKGFDNPMLFVLSTIERDDSYAFRLMINDYCADKIRLDMSKLFLKIIVCERDWMLEHIILRGVTLFDYLMNLLVSQKKNELVKLAVTQGRVATYDLYLIHMAEKWNNAGALDIFLSNTKLDVSLTDTLKNSIQRERYLMTKCILERYQKLVDFTKIWKKCLRWAHAYSWHDIKLMLLEIPVIRQKLNTKQIHFFKS